MFTDIICGIKMIKYNVNICDQIESELQVHFTKKCPNNCPFCVDALNKGLHSVGIRPDAMSIFQRISEHKDEVKSVGISGGEPMIYMTELLKLVKLIKNNTELKVYIITSLPYAAYKHREELFEIIDLCDGISISPQHYDEEVADKIRGHKSLYDRQKFYAELPHKEKITMNINMVKPFLCTKEEICRCIEHYNKLGFKSIKLAELFDRDDMYISFEDAFGIKLKSPFAHGCKTEFDITPWIPSFDGKFVLKRVCFLVCKLRHATLSDTFKAATRALFAKKYSFGVIYEDGSLHPYWI